MTPTDPIRHVVVLMLENRSFDQMLGSLKQRFPDLDGIDPDHPGVNLDDDGNSYEQRPHAEFQLPLHVDPKHEFKNVQRQLNDPAPMGGFVRDFLKAFPGRQDEAQQVMDYFQADDSTNNRLPAMHALAEEFLICDRWFSSVPGPTWPNRFFALSGTSNGWVDMPNWFHGWHLYDQTTLFDRLNERNVPWRVYRGDFPLSLLLLHQWWPKNLRRYRRMHRFFDDVADEASFPAFTFIEPSYFGGDQNDEHPPSNVLAGDALVASVYNAIRANEALWQSTLLVVLYDEHGGFYDHVDPPAAVPPDERAGNGFHFDRYGVRVPAILVSPHVRRAVSHVPFDHTSLLRYLQDKWGLGDLGARTAAANSIGPLVDAAASREASASMPWRNVPPTPAQPLNDLQQDMLGYSTVLEQFTPTSPAKLFMRPLRAEQGAEDARRVVMDRLDDFMQANAALPDDAPPAFERRPVERDKAADALATAGRMMAKEAQVRKGLLPEAAPEEVELRTSGPVSDAARAYLDQIDLPPDALYAELRLSIADYDLPWPIAEGGGGEGPHAQLAWEYLADVEHRLQDHVREHFGDAPVRAMIVGAGEGSLILAAVIVNISINANVIAAAGGGALLWQLKDYTQWRDSLQAMARDIRSGFHWIKERTERLKEGLRGKK
ncbi:MAG: hypothetical protein H6594_06505 [Flavobacteriales bacterium]|nr:hypothetical protein [Flavobacteriales bacterium]